MTTDDQNQVLVAGDGSTSARTTADLPPVLDRRVAAVAFDPRNRRLAYAAGGRLLRSTDGGATWPTGEICFR